MSRNPQRRFASLVAVIAVLGVVASGCGSDDAADRHAFFDPEDSPLRLDADFGLEGAMVADSGGMRSELGLDSQGNLYTVEGEYVSADRSWQTEVAKYSASGELVYKLQFELEDLIPDSDDISYDLQYLVDSNDRLVIKGFQPGSRSGYNHWIARLTSDGQVDTTFSDSGFVKSFEVNAWCAGTFVLSKDESVFHYVAECNPGSIVDATGESVDHGYNTYLMNISAADGQVQGSGWILLDGDPGNKISTTDENQFIIATRADNKIELRRYNRDGTLDRQFGFNGAQSHSPVGGAPNLRVNDIAIDEDGWIVVVGHTYGYDDNHEEAFIAMYDANGQPHDDFGPDGFNSVIVADPVSWGSGSSLQGVEWTAKHVAVNGSNYAVSVSLQRKLRLKDITKEFVAASSSRVVCGLVGRIFFKLLLIKEDITRFRDFEVSETEWDGLPVFDHPDPSLVGDEVNIRSGHRPHIILADECAEGFGVHDVHGVQEDPTFMVEVETAARKYLNEMVALYWPEADVDLTSDSREIWVSDFGDPETGELLRILGEDVSLWDSQETGIITFTRNPDVVYGYEGLFPSERYPVIPRNENMAGGNRHDRTYGLGVDSSGGVFLGTRLPNAPRSGIVRLERGLPSTEAGTFASAPMCGETLETAGFISWNIETNLPYGEFAYELETGAGIDVGFGLPRFHPSEEAVLNHTLGPIQEVPWSGSFRINGYDVRDVRDGRTDPVLIGSSEWFDPADPANGCALASIVVTETADATSVEENGGADTFAVRLNSVIHSGVTVAVTSSNVDDLAVMPAQLQFEPGNEFEDQQVVVIGVDDATQDGLTDRTVSLNIEQDSSFGSYANVGEATVSVAIIDDEQVAADQLAAAAEAQAAADAAAAEAAEAAAAEAAAAQEAAIQAAVEQALAEAEAAAAEAAAAEAAAAEAAAAEAAAAEAAAAEAAAAEAAAAEAAGAVSTGYTAEELASIMFAAEYLEMTLPEFQATGVYVIDFLTPRTSSGAYEANPIVDPPDVSGSESITSTWDAEQREVLGRVTEGYEVTSAEAQKFGAILLTFFVGLAAG